MDKQIGISVRWNTIQPLKNTTWLNFRTITKQKKPDTEEHILNSSIYMKF